MMPQSDLDKLCSLESLRARILLDQERTWKLKRGPMDRSWGSKYHSDFAYLRVDHFKPLFKEPKQVKIGEIIKVISYFSRLIEEEDNCSMYSVVHLNNWFSQR